MRRRVVTLAAVLAGTVAVAADNTFLARNEAGLLLDRSSGARATALGGAFTALADDPSAMAANPGGLGQLRSLHVTGTRDAVRMDGDWRGDFQMTAVAAAAPAWGGVGGIAVATLDYGTMDLVDAGGAVTGTGSARDVAVAASYAYVNPDWFNGGGGWSGATAELVRDTGGEVRPGISIGSVVPVTFRTSMAWALEHVGPKLHGGMLPSTLRAGMAYRDNNAPLPVLVALDASLPFVTGRYALSGGVDARVAAALSLRAGYTFRPGDGDRAGLTGIAGGVGVRLGQVVLDYAYQPFGDLLSTHKVSVTWVAEQPEPRPAAASTVRPPARPATVMPDVPNVDEPGSQDAEPGPAEPAPVTPPAVKPAGKPVVRAVPTPVARPPGVPAAKPPVAPKPAPVKPVPAPVQMPAEIPATEPAVTPSVPGTSTAPADDGWIGPPPTAGPQLLPEESPSEPAATPGGDNGPVAPIPGAGKNPGSKPRVGGL